MPFMVKGFWERMYRIEACASTALPLLISI